jgi:hypothetical protein
LRWTLPNPQSILTIDLGWNQEETFPYIMPISSEMLKVSSTLKNYKSNSEEIGKFQQPLNFFSVKKISHISENVTKQLKLFNSNSVMLGWIVKSDHQSGNFYSGSVYSKSCRVQSFWHHVLTKDCDLVIASDIYPRSSQHPDQVYNIPI